MDKVIAKLINKRERGDWTLEVSSDVYRVITPDGRYQYYDHDGADRCIQKHLDAGWELKVETDLSMLDDYKN